jgi:DNA-directed RNA polymerase subunit RPC12/RpoP
MPNLVCRTCGRQLSVTRLAYNAMTAENRRCPRCGVGTLVDDRRVLVKRRQEQRRHNPPKEPGPPDGTEKRVSERRHNHFRRRDDR